MEQATKPKNNAKLKNIDIKAVNQENCAIPDSLDICLDFHERIPETIDDVEGQYDIYFEDSQQITFQKEASEYKDSKKVQWPQSCKSESKDQTRKQSIYTALVDHYHRKDNFNSTMKNPNRLIQHSLTKTLSLNPLELRPKSISRSLFEGKRRKSSFDRPC